jgi:hypothetical protein
VLLRLRAARPATAARQKFFFEKKNQKTFALWQVVVAPTRVPSGKCFCFFFKK